MRANVPEILLPLYLQDILGDKYNPDIHQLDTASIFESFHKFRQALSIVEEELEGYLPLDAIGGELEATREERRAERANLFALLKRHLHFNAETNEFTTLSEKGLRAACLAERQGTDATPLQILHAQRSNLGLAEKLLAGTLHGQEWLTETDLHRLLAVTGLSDKVAVTRMDSSDIGLILHFARLQHAGATAPYKIPMILSKGTKGSFASQGQHWVNVTVTIDPSTTPQKVKIEYLDSLRNISADERARLTTIFTEAVSLDYEELTTRETAQSLSADRYRVEGDEASDDARFYLTYKAFPDATVDIDISASGLQRDAFTCGYRSFHSVLSQFSAADIEVDKRDAFMRVKDFEVTEDPRPLSRLIYELALGEVEFSDVVRATATQVDAAAFGSKGQLASGYLDDLLSYVTTLVPGAKAAVSFKSGELHLHKELDKEIEKQQEAGFVASIPACEACELDVFKYADDQTRLNGVKEVVVSGDYKLILDLDKLLAVDAADKAREKLIQKARIQLLAKYLKENKVAQLEIKDGKEVDTYLPELLEVLNDNPFLMQVEITESAAASAAAEARVRSDFRVATEQLTVRNKFFAMVGMDWETADSPELQFWYRRFNDRLLFPDDKSFSQHKLFLFPDFNAKDTLFHDLYKKIAKNYFDSLFEFLTAYSSVYQSNPGLFPFSILDFSTIGRFDEETQSQTFLTSLKAHMEKGGYLPFERLAIEIPSITHGLSADTFSIVNDILLLLKNYPHIKIFELSLTDSKNTSYSLTADQYQKLAKDFEEQPELSVEFRVVCRDDDLSIDLLEAKSALANARWENFRKHRAAKSTAMLKSTEPAEDEAEKLVVAPVVMGLRGGDQKRACKQKGYDVAKAAGVEVVAELELTHQLQREVQQTSVIEEEINGVRATEIADEESSAIALANSCSLPEFLGDDPDDMSAVIKRNVGLSQGVMLVEESLLKASIEALMTNNDVMVSLWRQITGGDESGRVLLPNSIYRISNAALNVLLAAPTIFNAGFNIDNMPAGFYVSRIPAKSGGGLMLGYDLDHPVENPNASPLTPDLQAITSRTRYSGDLRQFAARWSLVEGWNEIDLPSEIQERKGNISFPRGRRSGDETFGWQKISDLFDRRGKLKDLQSEIYNRLIALVATDEALAKTIWAFFQLDDFDAAQLIFQIQAEGDSHEFYPVYRILDEAMREVDSKEPITTYANKAWQQLLTGFCNMEGEKVAKLSKLKKIIAGALGKDAAEIFWDKHSALLASDFTDGKDAFALFDILFNHGIVGLDELLIALTELKRSNERLYYSVKEHFIVKNSNLFAQTADPDNIEVLQALTKFSPIQVQWWLELTETQTDIAGYGDLVEIYKAFTYFFEQLPKTLILPLHCPASLAKLPSTKVALDRLLAILGYVKPASLLQQQFDCLDGLDFSVEGAWYAMRWEGFHFCHPAMALTGNDLRDEDYRLFEKECFARETLTYKVAYPQLMQLAVLEPAKIATVDTEGNLLKHAVVAFHRFLGGAKFADSYELYIDLTKRLESTDFSAQLQTKLALLPVLALATTGMRGAKGFAAEDFFSFLQEKITEGHEDRLLEILKQLATNAEGFNSKPNLAEVKALINLLLNYDYSEAVATAADAAASAAAAEPTPIGATTVEQAFSCFLVPGMSTAKVWQAIQIIQQHDNAILVNDFITCLHQIADGAAFKDHLDTLANVVAMLKTPFNMTEFDHLIARLIGLQAEHVEVFDKVLETLATVDFASIEDMSSLPSVTDILTALEDVEAIDISEIPAYFASKLSIGEAMKVAVDEGPAPIVLSTRLQTAIKDLNAMLSSNSLTPWDVKELQTTRAATYIKSQYDAMLGKIRDQLAKVPDVARMASGIETQVIRAIKLSITDWFEQTALQELFQEAKAASPSEYSERQEKTAAELREAYNAIQKSLKELNKLTDPTKLFTAVADVKKSCDDYVARRDVYFVEIGNSPLWHLAAKFPMPEIAIDAADMGIKSIALLQYGQDAIGLFRILRRCLQRWGRLFNLAEIIDSVNVGADEGQLNIAHLTELFEAIDSQELAQPPHAILTAIFTAPAYAGRVSVDSLVEQYIRVINLPDLDNSQKANLITSLHDPAKRASINRVLSVLENRDASKTGALKFYLDNFSDFTVGLLERIDEVFEPLAMYSTYLNRLFNAIASLGDEANPTLELVINRFAALDKPEEMLQILCLGALADSDKVDRYHAVFVGSDSVLQKLVDLKTADVEKYQRIVQLFQRRPYPKYAALNRLLQPGVDFDLQLKLIQLDPTGGRRLTRDVSSGEIIADREVLEAQFDTATAHQRIDSIIDLKTNRPLAYPERQRMLQQMAYINAVGQGSVDLIIPGMTAEQKLAFWRGEGKKPVTNLTLNQIIILAKHYRNLVSGTQPASAKQVELARLEFIAVAREAMYRYSGKFPYTTQIIALLNVMQQGGSLFSEIRTGEGKGIITALFAAFKWMEGGAVDICSANMALASRDKEEFMDFFSALGIPCSLIRADSPAEVYQQEGVNYSDVGEMALFQQQRELFGEPLPEKVSCIMDEVDFAVLDSTVQFRFAASLDPSVDPRINPNAWVYSIILEYVSRKNADGSYQFDNNGLTRIQDITALQEWVIDPANGVDPKLQAEFLKFSLARLDRWLDAAVVARDLEQDNHFVVRQLDSDESKQLGYDEPVAVARVMINHRESSSSRFSDGVHQFLHARLNAEVKAGKLPGIASVFPIEPEKSYLASRSAKGVFVHYLGEEELLARKELRDLAVRKRRGDVLGLTGTAGSVEERAELAKTYGFKFTRIPPHKPLRRSFDDVVLARRETKTIGWWAPSKEPIETADQAHRRMIRANIQAAIERGQPILLICEGIKDSQALYEWLRGQPEFPSHLLQLCNGELMAGGKSDDEAIAAAGEAGMITVTTPRLGRGTNITLAEPGGPGLHVVSTAIAHWREYGQNIGRAARNGQKGSSTLIVSESEFTRRGMGVPEEAELPAQVERIRLQLAVKQAKERAIQQAIADIQDQFFQQYTEFMQTAKTSVIANFTRLRMSYRSTWDTIELASSETWERFLRLFDEITKEQTATLDQSLDPEEYYKKLLEVLPKIADAVNKEWKTTHDRLQRVVTSHFAEDYAEATKSFIASRQAKYELEQKKSAEEASARRAKNLEEFKKLSKKEPELIRTSIPAEMQTGAIEETAIKGQQIQLTKAIKDDSEAVESLPSVILVGPEDLKDWEDFLRGTDDAVGLLTAAEIARLQVVRAGDKVNYTKGQIILMTPPVLLPTYEEGEPIPAINLFAVPGSEVGDEFWAGVRDLSQLAQTVNKVFIQQGAYSAVTRELAEAYKTPAKILSITKPITVASTDTEVEPMVFTAPAELEFVFPDCKDAQIVAPVSMGKVTELEITPVSRQLPVLNEMADANELILELAEGLDSTMHHQLVFEAGFNRIWDQFVIAYQETFAKDIEVPAELSGRVECLLEKVLDMVLDRSLNKTMAALPRPQALYDSYRQVMQLIVFHGDIEVNVREAVLNAHEAYITKLKARPEIQRNEALYQRTLKAFEKVIFDWHDQGAFAIPVTVRTAAAAEPEAIRSFNFELLYSKPGSRPTTAWQLLSEFVEHRLTEYEGRRSRVDLTEHLRIEYNNIKADESTDDAEKARQLLEVIDAAGYEAAQDDLNHDERVGQNGRFRNSYQGNRFQSMLDQIRAETLNCLKAYSSDYDYRTHSIHLVGMLNIAQQRIALLDKELAEDEILVGLQARLLKADDIYDRISLLSLAARRLLYMADQLRLDDRSWRMFGSSNAVVTAQFAEDVSRQIDQFRAAIPTSTLRPGKMDEATSVRYKLQQSLQARIMKLIDRKKVLSSIKEELFTYYAGIKDFEYSFINLDKEDDRLQIRATFTDNSGKRQSLALTINRLFSREYVDVEMPQLVELTFEDEIKSELGLLKSQGHEQHLLTKNKDIPKYEITIESAAALSDERLALIRKAVFTIITCWKRHHPDILQQTLDQIELTADGKLQLELSYFDSADKEHVESIEVENLESTADISFIVREITEEVGLEEGIDKALADLVATQKIQGGNAVTARDVDLETEFKGFDEFLKVLPAGSKLDDASYQLVCAAIHELQRCFRAYTKSLDDDSDLGFSDISYDINSGKLYVIAYSGWTPSDLEDEDNKIELVVDNLKLDKTAIPEFALIKGNLVAAHNLNISVSDLDLPGLGDIKTEEGDLRSTREEAAAAAAKPKDSYRDKFFDKARSPVSKVSDREYFVIGKGINPGRLPGLSAGG